MNGLHHALYIASLIAFAGAADRAASRSAATRAPHRTREPAPSESTAQATWPADAGAAARRRAAGSDRGGGARGVRLGSYARSTTAEIARVAGVSEPIIYRHFPSKKELWFASLDEAWRELRAAIEHKSPP